MAWTVKPSATTEIPTRDEPYLTAEMKAKFTADLIPRYQEKRGALMPILHAVQHAHGYIPHQAMVEIAELLDITPSDVLDTASFYEALNLRAYYLATRDVNDNGVLDLDYEARRRLGEAKALEDGGYPAAMPNGEMAFGPLIHRIR